MSTRRGTRSLYPQYDASGVELFGDPEQTRVESAMLDFFIGLLVVALCMVLGTVRFGPLGWMLGLAGYVAAASALLGFSKLRHGRMIRRWASQERLTVVRVQAMQGFIDPAPMPWWRGFAAYQVWGHTAAGDERHYSVFLTGVFFCLYSVDISIERDD